MMNPLTSQEEILLACRELMRQAAKMRNAYGDEAINQALSSSPEADLLTNVFEGLSSGRLTQDDVQENIDEVDELLGRATRESDDPGFILALDAENVAIAKGLSDAARLLVSDAFKSAAQGVAKEEWIAEVLRGHVSSGARLQLGCLNYIVQLWDDGPWAWPEAEETAGKS
jgi:hypothetical protein